MYVLKVFISSYLKKILIILLSLIKLLKRIIKYYQCYLLKLSHNGFYLITFLQAWIFDKCMWTFVDLQFDTFVKTFHIENPFPKGSEATITMWSIGFIYFNLYKSIFQKLIIKYFPHHDLVNAKYFVENLQLLFEKCRVSCTSILNRFLVHMIWGLG